MIHNFARFFRIPFDKNATGDAEPKRKNPRKWGPVRLRYEMRCGGRLACAMLVIGYVGAVGVLFLLPCDYWGATAGALAFLAVVAAWRSYFTSPQLGDNVLAPNLFVAKCVGLLLGLSAVFWTLDGLRGPMCW